MHCIVMQGRLHLLLLHFPFLMNTSFLLHVASSVVQVIFDHHHSSLFCLSEVFVVVVNNVLLGYFTAHSFCAFTNIFSYSQIFFCDVLAVVVWRVRGSRCNWAAVSSLPPSSWPGPGSQLPANMPSPLVTSPEAALDSDSGSGYELWQTNW